MTEQHKHDVDERARPQNQSKNDCGDSHKRGAETALDAETKPMDRNEGKPEQEPETVPAAELKHDDNNAGPQVGIRNAPRPQLKR